MSSKVEKSFARLSEMAGSSLRDYKNTLLDELCALTGSQMAYVAAMNLEEDMLTMVGWSKTAMANCGIIDQPIVYELTQTGLWGDAVRERQPVITNDYQRSNSPTKKGYPAGHVQVTNHMSLPIFEGDRIALVVGVGNKDGDYTLEDAQNIEAVMSEVWQSFKLSLWDATW